VSEPCDVIAVIVLHACFQGGLLEGSVWLLGVQWYPWLFIRWPWFYQFRYVTVGNFISAHTMSPKTPLV